MKHFAVEGVWWLPEKPNRQIPGTLTFDSDGVELVLHGALREFVVSAEEVVRSPVPEWRVTPVVHGRSRERQAITLLGVGGAHFEGPSDDVEEDYRVDFALVGRHTAVDLFVGTRIEFDALDAWAEPPSIRGPASESDVTNLDLTHHELAAADLPFGAIRLVAGVQGSVGDDEVHVERSTGFVVSLAQPLSAKTILDSIVRPLSDLLTLALGRSIRIASWTLEPSDGDEREGLASAYFAAVQAGEAVELSRTSVLSYSAPTLLTARDSPVALNELIRRWFDVWAAYRDSTVLLLGPYYAPFVFSQHQYASTFQAAEAYHKTNQAFSGRELEPTDHARRVEAVLSAIDSVRSVGSQDLAWARRVIQARNDKTLRQMIEEVLRSAGAIGDRILSAAPEFPKVAAGARAAVSHPGGKSLDSVGRLWFGEALRWTMRARLLIELGVPLEEVERRVLNRAGFQRVLTELARISEAMKS